MDFSDPLKKLWNVWEIRSLILCSMILQILLIILAPLRKGKWSKIVSPLIWAFYLLADSVAALALGNLINAQGDNSHCHDNKQSVSCANHSELMAFWAPFLLLHLGGPDTITAFAIEDNELWLRHALLLIFEVLTTSYVFVRALPMNRLLVPFLLMFMAGIIKYGERTGALYLASMPVFMDSIVRKYSRIPKTLQEFIEKEDDGAIRKTLSDIDVVEVAHLLFKSFKGVIVNMIFPLKEGEMIRSFFQKLSATDAFKVVDVELGFIYDVLYTKAGMLHSSIGYILRTICSFSIWTSFLLFNHKNHYNKFDVGITYALLISAIVIDVIAFMMLIWSDWTIVSLGTSHHLKPMVSVVQKFFPFLTRPRWSDTMLQYNLVDISLIQRWRCVDWLVEKFGIGNVLNYVKYTPRARVTNELKEFIFEELKRKSNFAYGPEAIKKLCSSRGDWVLEKSNCPRMLNWSIENVEFDDSLLMWHIATDICYNTDKCSDTNSGNQETGLDTSRTSDNRRESNTPYTRKQYKEIGKNIADYMLYLLVNQHLMLSSITGNKFHETCLKVKELVHERRISIKNDVENALSEGMEIIPVNSILFGAATLAKQLDELPENMKWRMICEVWVELLSYTASQFREVSRGEQLSKGGELVMFVRFLMFHLGLSEQFSSAQPSYLPLQAMGALYMQ